MSDDETPDLSTGIEGLEADSLYQNTPCFDVTSKEFFGNMRKERNRIRFTSDKPKQFMQATNYRKPFYISYTDKNNGKQFLNKIK